MKGTRSLATLFGWLLFSAAAHAQGGPVVADSTVGYIDPAIPGTYFRLRYDAAYDFTVPNRGEFFYARSGSPGLPLPEKRIDYQELSGYLEYAPWEQFSVFASVPFRFLNPEVNENHTGLSDVDAGCKYAFLWDPDLVLTGQLRVYAPSGDVSRGLGNGHASIEPALLNYARWTERLATEAELRYWTAVGGTEGFAGSLVRYGIGFEYQAWKNQDWIVAPVVEFVGWTFLSGASGSLLSTGEVVSNSAAGDTIINAKLGVRVKLQDVGSVYLGYGHCLTGDSFYRDVLRLEWRLQF
jgi:hypothetical protein